MFCSRYCVLRYLWGEEGKGCGSPWASRVYAAWPPLAHSDQGPSAATPASTCSAAITSGRFIQAVRAVSAAEQGLGASRGPKGSDPPVCVSEREGTYVNSRCT